MRIITDDETIGANGCDIQNLADAGIPIRLDSDKMARMHHKFIVIDDEILINGSFNWTWTAIKSNNENLVFSSDQTQVQLFKEEFSRLWKLYQKGQLDSNGEVADYLRKYHEKFVSEDRYNKDNTRSYLTINDVVPIKKKY